VENRKESDPSLHSQIFDEASDVKQNSWMIYLKQIDLRAENRRRSTPVDADRFIVSDAYLQSGKQGAVRELGKKDMTAHR